MSFVKERLSTIQQRCAQALKAFEQSDYRLALKALSGFEVDISLVRTTLRDYLKEQNQTKTNQQERRNR
ncbi:MAG: hypothetical protein DMG65_22185 [Candidatus Angelobacter sp. Gp1-AA117]|nr:MAG: hypothetical protein DMG65_22185 [Candidatus Angelobacter sp. Gp1-AA117]